MLTGNVLVTGGTGTLGKAIVARSVREKWDCRITVLSRDPLKQQAMQRVYPRVRYVLADIGNPELLRAAFAGHDTVIHAAAQKHIPEAEANPRACYAVNVQGSLNVLDAALAAGCTQLLAISTDKACWPVNIYGNTKQAMERMLQQAALAPGCPLKINLCRYGNVVGSAGSVLEVWARELAQEKRCYVTDPAMTRFWLSTEQAIDLILFALIEPTGTITIPRLPALSMGKLLEYRVPSLYRSRQPLGLRPGEKMHEMLLTPEEAPYCSHVENNYMCLEPVTVTPGGANMEQGGYTSDKARELTLDELNALVAA